jgi:ankyrin repeat protein
VIAAILVLALAATADRPLGDEFAVVISKGNLAALKELVEGGADPNTVIGEGMVATTPLIKASWEGRRDIIKYLLSKGANVNAHNGDGQTALMQTVVRGFDDVVEVLLAAGADVKARDSRGMTAFVLAADNAGLEIADVLIKHGADPDSVDLSGITALMTAADQGNEEVVRYLVKAGARVNRITQLEYGGQTPLTGAAGMGQVATVKALLELGADPSLKMKDGGTALSNAKENGNPEVVALITAALARPRPAARAAAPPKPKQ